MKRYKGKSKKFYIIISACLLLCLVGSGVSASEFHKYSVIYHNDTFLASMAIAHLRTAEALLKTLPKDPFNQQSVTQAQREFTAALTNLFRLDDDLQSLPAISTSIPAYGSRLRGALHLLPIAIEISQTGIITCNMLNLIITRFHNPLDTHNQGLTMTDFMVIQKDFQQIKVTFNLMVAQVTHLQRTDLQVDPRLNQIFATFQQDLPLLQSWLAMVEKLLPVIPALLGIGTPTNYLIELLDSTELRPGGGFIGNYGIATLSGGRLTSAHITDTYLLDDAYTAAGHSIPLPAAYNWFDIAPTWSLRDSNLEADFPTTAQYAEANYTREGGNIPVQGVIAITPALIQDALKITGPVSVPEYHETVTSQNLVDRIHYYQVGPGQQGEDTPSPDGLSSLRKHFTALLAEHFLARVRQLSSAALPKLLGLMVYSLRSKNLQIYLNSNSAEDLLRRLHLDASIQAPGGDSFFVVDANIAGDKANRLITNTLNDQVTIDVNGNAVHHTTLRYAWVTQPSAYDGSPLYRDYVRIYTPPGSILRSQNGWEYRGTSQAYGRQVWAGFFTLSYGQTKTITFDWMEVHVAAKYAKGWQYQYLIQRQAGIQWILHLHVTLPTCAAMINKSGGLLFNDRQQTMTLTQALTEDMNVGLGYSC